MATPLPTNMPAIARRLCALLSERNIPYHYCHNQGDWEIIMTINDHNTMEVITEYTMVADLWWLT